MLTNRKPVTALLSLGTAAFLALLPVGCTPPGPRALLEGEQLLNAGKTTEAVARLREAVGLLPQNAQAWNHLGLALHSDHQPQEAAKAYRHALELDKNLAVARFNLGCLLLEHNEPALAAREFTTYTILKPDALDGWVQLGNAQLRSRQFDAAQRTFEIVNQRSPKHPAALNGFGVIQLNRRPTRDSLNQAFARFQEAVQKQPDFAPAVLNLAIFAHQYSTNRAYALDKYREYVRLEPSGPQSGAVKDIIRKLELEMRPAPPSVAAVAPPAQTNLTRAVVTNTPPPATVKTSAPPVVTTVAANNQKPTNVVDTTKAKSATKSETKAPPPIVTPLPPPPKVETVQPKPEPKTEPKPAVATTAPKPATPEPVATNTALPSSASAQAAGKNSETEKQGLLQKINPANLFKGRPPKPTTALPSTKTASTVVTNTMVVAAATNTAPAPPPIPPRPPIVRYDYQSPRKPSAGKRPEAQAAFARGLETHRAGKAADALADYRDATRLDPSFFEAQYNLGLAAYESRQTALALAAYEMALAINPEAANARYNFALTLQQGKYYQDAANELDRLLATQPKDGRAHLTLANLCAQQLFDFPKAKEHYREVLKLEPQHPQAAAIRYWLATHP